MLKIGDKVVCVEPKAGIIEDGQIYTIESIKVCRCGMKKVKLVDVDMSKRFKRSRCIKCGFISADPSWFRAIRFNRYVDNFAEEVLSKISKSIYKLI